ncbi:hypothetical protein FHQ26_12135 [Testudinibacter sp. TR-2022]|uniref:hypothetical protein n=1 Tax=Testudinibacter sp. TR-2022 TaxID=2585029 RepID=UPI001118DAAE|nr:hypothetical protein [Testudinibacter sp. TR-2022]TNH04935.1 hypothetical protein FHQ26_12135 [Testudinibacter sp. TR-2022]TNH14385.1 hypothetical protein FIA56_05555 [Testudinibacter sp. TR-2022]TNH20908.1 hypothetical protein FHQ23_00005 [Testudinibacter sp. TR-2022]
MSKCKNYCYLILLSALLLFLYMWYIVIKPNPNFSQYNLRYYLQTHSFIKNAPRISNDYFFSISLSLDDPYEYHYITYCNIPDLDKGYTTLLTYAQQTELPIFFSYESLYEKNYLITQDGKKKLFRDIITLVKDKGCITLLFEEYNGELYPNILYTPKYNQSKK